MKPEIEPDNDATEPVNTVGNTGNLTSWKRGTSGNVKGRPKGSRNRLSEKLLAGLERIYDIKGDAGLMQWANRDPGQFYKTIAATIPRKLETSLEVTSVFAELNLTDPRDYAVAWELARKMLYGEAPIQIDAAVEPELEAETAWRIDGDA